MSELKVYEAYICSHEFLPEEAPKDCNAIVSSNSRYAKDDWWDNAKEFECYLKAEADKVIAHHKYKRCLAMAKWCKAEQDAAFLRYNWDSGRYAEVEFYERWNERWLKIAEKFKEV